MRDVIVEVIRALFIQQGRLFGPKSIVFITLIGALIWFTFEGIVDPEAFIAMVSIAGTYFFVKQDDNANGS